MKVYEFIYCDCIYESAYATVSMHKTLAGAYKSMRSNLLKEYDDWYNNRIMFGKDRDRTDKFGIFSRWSVRDTILQD